MLYKEIVMKIFDIMFLQMSTFKICGTSGIMQAFYSIAKLVLLRPLMLLSIDEESQMF